MYCVKLIEELWTRFESPVNKDLRVHYELQIRVHIRIISLVFRLFSKTVLVSIASRAWCISSRILGSAGYTFLRSLYSDCAISLMSRDSINGSTNLCSSVLIIFEGLDVKSSVAFHLTSVRSCCLSIFLLSLAWLWSCAICIHVLIELSVFKRALQVLFVLRQEKWSVY